jgi:hypothetical protein
LIIKARERSMSPKAIESIRLPLDVSRDMAVVKVLVNPLILPPISMETPTSDIALPKPSITALIIA